MAATNDSDAIVVLERSSRRQFIRKGSAYLIAGVSSFSAGAGLAADCDRGQTSYCTDSDSGENSDGVGCGKCGREDTIPSSMLRDNSAKIPGVVKIVDD